MLSHREFDFASHSYRLGGSIDKLRDKGWTIVDHDEAALTNDVVKRIVTFTRYELFAEFTPELAERIKAFCKAVDELEARAAATAHAQNIKQMRQA
jgi:predicted lipoprotein